MPRPSAAAGNASSNTTGAVMATTSMLVPPDWSRYHSDGRAVVSDWKVAAHGAARVAPGGHGAEGHVTQVAQQHPPRQGLAQAGQHLDRLHRPQAAHRPRHRPEHGELALPARRSV